MVWCGWSCCWCSLMRVIRSRRSAAVNVQLNGLAAWLYRSVKASRVADSCSRLSKSLGVTTFFWITEKKISSGNPGALPRRGPLRTGRARFPGSSAQASP
jgi:hypothetical protein